jgi:hypothetical protein
VIARRFLSLALLVAVLLALPASASAEFGITGFEGVTVDREGNVDNRAGAHPYEQRFSFGLTTKVNGTGDVEPDGNLKNLEIDFPPGFVGDPSAASICTEAQFETPNVETFTQKCPDGSQVGVVELDMATGGTTVNTFKVPLWNMGSQEHVPAEFAYQPLGALLHTRAFLRTGQDDGITIVTRDIPQPVAVVGARVFLWGVPSDPGHDEMRNRFCGAFFCVSEGHKTEWPRQPFITSPTDCSQDVLVSEIRASSWQNPDQVAKAQFTAPGPVGCEKLSFTPTFAWQPDNQRAGAPSGYSFDLHVPLTRNPDGFAVPPVKKVVATLPEGTSLSPGGSDGLDSCSLAQVGFDNAKKPECPATSAIGDATLETPLVPKDLKGTIYLAKPHDNPFGSLFAIYIVFEGFGTTIKLAGHVEPDPRTGQIKAVFDDAPQLPFSDMHIHFGGGSRAPLSNPTTCGRKTMTMTMESWSEASVTNTSSFDVNQACERTFSPKLEAGAKSAVAGAESPFVFRLVRADQEQTLKTIDVTLPPGQAAVLRGVPYCSEAALAAISSAEGTAATEKAAPKCPAASEIGTSTVTAGPGPTPLYMSGKVYLAGPYKGAPLSLAVVSPAISGPYDLGSVVVRSALHVNPVTAQVEAVTDPLPTILYGVPLSLREVWVNLDRPHFTVNPTNCEPMSADGLFESYEGSALRVASPYQVGDCAALDFAPKLSLRLKGPTTRASYPSVRAVLKARPGDANIGRAQVTLPRTEFLEQAHIRTICTRVQYAAKECPAASIYGYAKAFTPITDKPLEGPVYLRASDHPLPDLVASLDGQIHIDVAARIDATKGQIRNTFESVPDAPVTKFVLSMQGGKKGLLVNSTDLCSKEPRAKVSFTGQNGKVHRVNPRVATDCGRRGKKKR